MWNERLVKSPHGNLIICFTHIFLYVPMQLELLVVLVSSPQVTPLTL
jgi:hypothetical protein